MPTPTHEDIKFLIEMGQNEANTMWARTNLFLLINVATLGSLVAVLSGDSVLPTEMALIIGVVGFIICLLWLQAHRSGLYYAQRWREDVKRLLRYHPDLVYLKEIYYYTYQVAKWGDEVAGPSSAYAQRNPYPKPRGPKVTTCFYLLCTVFAAAWVAIAVSAAVTVFSA